MSLAEVKINPIYIYTASRAWQNNHGSKRICIVLGLPYWSRGYIPFCGGDLRKVLAFHLALHSGEVYAKPHRNVVGCLQRHENSPHLFFFHHVKIMHFNVQTQDVVNERRDHSGHELHLINISDHRAAVYALKWDLGRPI